MQSVDWLAIGILLLSLLLGALAGFGNGLKWFTKGIIGFIISVFFCYTFGGMILKIPFVADLLVKLAHTWDKSGAFYSLLKTIHLEVIIYYIILFVIAQFIRIFLVRLIKRIVELENVVMKVINKVLGALLFLGMTILFALFIFQIIDWIGGETRANFITTLTGALKLNKLFLNNPLNALVELVKNMW